jgi:hypothetical protein
VSWCLLYFQAEYVIIRKQTLSVIAVQCQLPRKGELFKEFSQSV